jgi:biotin transporter BioY
MAVIDQPTSHREELGLVVERADQRFAITAVLITIGTPVVAYLSGVASLMFYVHMALGAFWFGLDFFFQIRPRTVAGRCPR